MATAPLRILVHGMSSGMGGIEKYLLDIYENINKEKIQFDFIISGNSCIHEDKINQLGGKIHYVTPRKKNLIKNYLELNKIYKKQTYQITYHNLTNLYYSLEFLLSVKNKRPIKIIHSHNTKSTKMNFVYYLLHLINRKYLAKKADFYFACSSPAAEWLFGKKLKSRAIIIPNAIKVENFIYSKEVSLKIKQQLNIENKLVIGNVARFAHQKNHNFLVDIFYEVYMKDNNTALMLIGTGELEHIIKAKVNKLGISENVLFMGDRFDVNELLQAMDVFVLPSNFEGLPISLIEAQASGLKCFTSDVVTIEVKITDLLDYLSLEESPKVWAKRILDNKDKLERKDMKQEIIDAGFEIKQSAKSLEEFFLSTLDIS